jgi:hypothetical protein
MGWLRRRIRFRNNFVMLARIERAWAVLEILRYASLPLHYAMGALRDNARFEYLRNSIFMFGKSL